MGEGTGPGAFGKGLLCRRDARAIGASRKGKAGTTCRTGAEQAVGGRQVNAFGGAGVRGRSEGVMWARGRLGARDLDGVSASVCAPEPGRDRAADGGRGLHVGESDAREPAARDPTGYWVEKAFRERRERHIDSQVKI